MGELVHRLLNHTPVIVALFLVAGAAFGSGLTDRVMLGDVKSLTDHAYAGVGKAQVFTGRVGTVQEKMPCLASGSKSGDAFQITLAKTAGKSCVVQIQEVYPPDSEGIRYTYEVQANKKLVYIRDYPGTMFSRVSYFIKLDSSDAVKASKVNLRFVNRRSGTPARIASVWVYSDFDSYYRAAKFAVPFYLTPLLHGGFDDPRLEEDYKYLKTNVHPEFGGDVKLGCSTEHHYMNRDPELAKKDFAACLALSKKYDMPMNYLFVSWWGGTPMGKPDGQGGALSDPKYQQICWSETDTYDDPGLKELLGDKWDIRYGFSTPNQWSNVPWLTMNSDVLNQAKWAAMEKSHKSLAEVLGGPESARWLLGFSMENEPRYWDNYCPDGRYPVKRENLEADFNPLTVAAAAKDGVTLDPKDGLDEKERLWLHENVARYQQEFYDAHIRALEKVRATYIHSESTEAIWHDVYSHAFTAPAYPMDKLTKYKPVLEWNRLNGCRAGLEGLNDPLTSCLDVTREWGRWAQVNYEENNGRGTEWHLRELRASYAYGARFYNFYNWQGINKEGRWLEYVNKFCKDGTKAIVFERKADADSSFVKSQAHGFAVEIPVDWPIFNGVRLSVEKPGEYQITVYDSEKKGRALGYRDMYVSDPAQARFDLQNAVNVEYGAKPFIKVVRADGKPFGLRKNKYGEVVTTISMDYGRERAQSMLTCWRADAAALIADLSARSAAGLSIAKGLLNKGDYRKAYEEAIQVECAHQD